MPPHASSHASVGTRRSSAPYRNPCTCELIVTAPTVMAPGFVQAGLASCGVYTNRPRQVAARPRVEPAGPRRRGGKLWRRHHAHSRLLYRARTPGHLREPCRDHRLPQKRPGTRTPRSQLQLRFLPGPVSIQINTCCSVESAKFASHARPVHDLYAFAMTRRTLVGTLATGYRANGER
jgi:hypothetical protein